MNNIKKIEKLLEEDLLIELKESIEELKNVIKKLKDSVEIKEANEELENMCDLEEDFISLLKDAKKGDLSEEEAKEILEELEEMKLDDNDL